MSLRHNEASRFTDKYKILGELGKGSFSIVKKCVQKSTGVQFAAKIMSTRQMSIKDLQDLNTEIRICRKLDHPNIVQFYDAIQEVYYQYLIFELMSGGELLDDIVERVSYSETDASHCIQQVLEAVKYCHRMGIIHRDLKPDNLLLASKTPGAAVKLIDFGLAVEILENKESFFGAAGTLIYMSPEILEMEPYGRAVDVWSCGVILYILLVGNPPFWHYDQESIIERIKSGKYHTKSQEWLTLTPAAQNLIDLMLNVNSKKRITANQALDHPWIRRRDSIASDLNRQVIRDSLKEFNIRRKLRGAMLKIKAVQSLASKNIFHMKPSSAPNTSGGEVSTATEEAYVLNDVHRNVQGMEEGTYTEEVNVLDDRQPNVQGIEEGTYTEEVNVLDDRQPNVQGMEEGTCTEDVNVLDDRQLNFQGMEEGTYTEEVNVLDDSQPNVQSMDKGTYTEEVNALDDQSNILPTEEENYRRRPEEELENLQTDTVIMAPSFFQKISDFCVLL